MKKIFTLLFVSFSLLAQGKTYTLADLATLVGTITNQYESGSTTVTETVGVSVVNGKYTIILPTGLASGVSGITFDEGNIILSKSYLTVNGDIVINEGDTLLFDKKAQLEIKGSLTATGAVFGAAPGAETGSNGAKGIRMITEGKSATLTNCIFNYVNINYGNGSETGCLTAKGCTFNKQNTKGGNAAINFTSKSTGNLIENCTFEDCDLSSVASGSNVACGITIKNNVINKPNASTRLYPGINMSATGPYDIIIDGNQVHGPAAVTKAGGIAVSCLLGNPPTGTIYVRNNFVENCSYGITLTGPGYIRMENNTVKNNKYIDNPNNGGSGLNITCNSTGEGIIAKAYMRGNHIEGNLWGITVIKNVDIDAGTEADPGRNTFVNNGNNAPYEKCDFYNNTDKTSYAQGNTWNVDVQDEENIEKVIVHKKDDSSLGEVIFMPPLSATGINNLNNDTKTNGARYNLLGQPVNTDYKGVVIENGKKVIKK